MDTRGRYKKNPKECQHNHWANYQTLNLCVECGTVAITNVKEFYGGGEATKYQVFLRDQKRESCGEFGQGVRRS